jgi:PAS domain S-box-containing protein
VKPAHWPSPVAWEYDWVYKRSARRRRCRRPASGVRISRPGTPGGSVLKGTLSLRTARAPTVTTAAAIVLVTVALAVVTALAVAIDIRTRVSVAAVGWLYLLIILPVTLRWGRTAGLVTAAVAAFLLITFLTEPRGLPYTRNGIDLIRLLLSIGCVAAAVFFVRPAGRERTEQDRNVAEIVALSDEATVGLSLDGTILNWSAGAGRLYGYSTAEVLGRHISLLAPAGQADTSAEIYERFARGERILQFETMGLACGSRPIDVAWTVSPLRDASGALNGASIRVQDITARRSIERAFHAGSASLCSAMENGPTGMLILDANGRVLLANEQADTLLRPASTPVRGCFAGALLTNQFNLHPVLRWDAVARSDFAKFVALDSHGTSSGLHVEIVRLAVESPVNSARYVATIRDATPELQVARDQLLWREDSYLKQPASQELVLQPAEVALQPPIAVVPRPHTNGQHAEERELPSQHGLTNREIEVLSLIARSRSNQEIAEELGISLNTVERHVANIYRKLNIRGRVHATAYALQHGIAPPYGL